MKKKNPKKRLFFEHSNRCNSLIQHLPNILSIRFFTEEDNTSNNYGVDLADEDTKINDDYARSPYGFHSVPFS